MDPKALFSITYGLYLLSVRSYGQDNASIINTVVQVSLNPLHIAVSMTKGSKITRPVIVLVLGLLFLKVLGIL